MAPIYVINLARRPDRLAGMTQRLGAAGLPFTRIDAIDGRSADPEWLAGQFAPPGPLGALSPAEQACALSHFEAYRQFLSSTDAQVSHAVILEDDIRLSDDAGRLLSSLDWAPKSTDLLKIERERPQVLLGKGTRVGGPGGPLVARLYSDHTCAAGYIISRAAAQTLAAMDAKPSLMIDFLLFHPIHSPTFRRLRPGQLVPALVEQMGQAREDSDIEPSRRPLTPIRLERVPLPVKLRRELLRLRNQARRFAPMDLGGARWTAIGLATGAMSPDTDAVVRDAAAATVP